MATTVANAVPVTTPATGTALAATATSAIDGLADPLRPVSGFRSPAPRARPYGYGAFLFILKNYIFFNSF